MKELLDLILKNSLPEGVDYKLTERVEDDGVVVYEMEMPEEFKGKIIGKAGRNISAIRQILSLIARKQDKRVILKMID